MQISESMRTVYTERNFLENVLFKAINEKETKRTRVACKVGFIALAILLSATVVGLAVVIPCALIYRKLSKENQIIQSIPAEIFSNGKNNSSPSIFDSLINSRNIAAVTTYLRRAILHSDAASAVIKSYRNDDSGELLYTWVMSDIISRSDQQYVSKELTTGNTEKLIDLLDKGVITKHDCYQALFRLYQQIPQYQWYDSRMKDNGIENNGYKYGDKLFSHMIRVFNHLNFDDVLAIFADREGLLLRSEKLQMTLPFLQVLSAPQMLQILSIKDKNGKIFLDYSSLQDNTKSCFSLVIPCLHRLTLQDFIKFLLLRKQFKSDSFKDLHSIFYSLVELVEDKSNGKVDLENVFPVEFWSMKLVMEFSTALDASKPIMFEDDFEKLNAFRYDLLKEMVFKQINEIDPSWKDAAKLLIDKKEVLLLKIGESQKFFLSNYLTQKSGYLADLIQKDAFKDKITKVNFKGVDFDAIDLNDPQIDIDSAVLDYLTNPTLDNFDEIDQKSRDFLKLMYINKYSNPEIHNLKKEGSKPIVRKRRQVHPIKHKKANSV